MNATCNFEDHYEIPREGFIFRSRAKATAAHLHYHAVYAHVKKQAPRFLDFLNKNGKKWGHEVAKLRPRSGRATLITELMGDGLSTALSMKYAKCQLRSRAAPQRGKLQGCVNGEQAEASSPAVYSCS